MRSASGTSCLLVIGNFEVTAQTGSVTFPVAGTWYNYLTGGTITATGAAQPFTLQPGEYYIFLNRNLVNAVITSAGGPSLPQDKLGALVYPNPAAANSTLEIYMPKTGRAEAYLFNATGQQVNQLYSGNLLKGMHRIAVAAKINNLPAGCYWIRITAAGQSVPVKFVIQ